VKIIIDYLIPKDEQLDDKSSKGADVVQHDVGVAVEVWCRGDVGGQAPSGLTASVGDG